MKRYRFWTALGLLLAIILSTACGAQQTTNRPPVSALSESEALALAEEAMDGFARGDYAAWSRAWSPAMKGAISENDFLAYREEVSQTMGTYQAIESIGIVPSETKGYVRWLVVANFENGQMEFAFSFQEDGRLIEGIFPRRLG